MTGTIPIPTDALPPSIPDGPPSRPLVLSAEEAAAIFHKSARAWRNWDATGKVPSPIRIGRSTYWLPDEITNWIAAGCPDREAWEFYKKRDCETSDEGVNAKKTAR